MTLLSFSTAYGNAETLTTTLKFALTFSKFDNLRNLNNQIVKAEHYYDVPPFLSFQKTCSLFYF